jgi:hypothetical protein
MRVKNQCDSGGLGRRLLDDCLKAAVRNWNKKVAGWIRFSALYVLKYTCSSQTHRNRRSRDKIPSMIFLTVDTYHCFG